MKPLQHIHYILQVGPDIRLLEQNLRYYSEIGVDKILISVHVYEEHGKQQLPIVTDIAKKYGAVIADIHEGQGLDSSERYARIVSKYCDVADWIVIADLDEFIQFPLPLSELTVFLEEEKFDSIQGIFLDRIAADGRFPEFSEKSIWDQFPIGANITREICQGNENKITLARPWVTVASGHHYTKNGNDCPRKQCMSIVHHFKWDASVIPRCSDMITLYNNTGVPWAIEPQRLLTYFHGTKNTIDLTDARLGAYWPAYKRNLKHPCWKQSNVYQITTDPNLLFPNQRADTHVQNLAGDTIQITHETSGRTVQVNPISLFLYDRADGRDTIQQICSQLAASFPESWWQIERDVQAAYRQLCQAKMVSMKKDREAAPQR